MGTTFVGGGRVVAGREDKGRATERPPLPGRNQEDDIVAWDLVVVVTEETLLEAGDDDARELDIGQIEGFAKLESDVVLALDIARLLPNGAGPLPFDPFLSLKSAGGRAGAAPCLSS